MTEVNFDPQVGFFACAASTPQAYKLLLFSSFSFSYPNFKKFKKFKNWLTTWKSDRVLDYSEIYLKHLVLWHKQPLRLFRGYKCPPNLLIWDNCPNPPPKFVAVGWDNCPMAVMLAVGWDNCHPNLPELAQTGQNMLNLTQTQSKLVKNGHTEQNLPKVVQT